MVEFENVVYELLNAEMGTGGKLAGIQILDRDITKHFKADDFPLINIEGFSDTPLASRTEHYRLYRGRMYIFILVQWDSKDKDYRARKTDVENYMNIVQEILLKNPNLVTASYSNGFAIQEEDTKFGEIAYGPDIVGGVKVAAARAVFEAVYLKRGGTISQE